MKRLNEIALPKFRNHHLIIGLIFAGAAGKGLARLKNSYRDLKNEYKSARTESKLMKYVKKLADLTIKENPKVDKLALNKWKEDMIYKIKTGVIKSVNDVEEANREALKTNESKYIKLPGLGKILYATLISAIGYRAYKGYKKQAEKDNSKQALIKYVKSLVEAAGKSKAFVDVDKLMAWKDYTIKAIKKGEITTASEVEDSLKYG